MLFVFVSDMKLHRNAILVVLAAALLGGWQAPQSANAYPATPLGFRDFSRQQQIEKQFLQVPDPKLAQEHLRTLTAVPHIAGSPEDRATADYVAEKFREAGLDTQIVEYRVWMNRPTETSVDVTDPPAARHHGPTREHVNGDPYQDDPRVVVPMNGSSASGDVQAEVVYANYGRPEDYKKLEDLHIDVRGKIVLVRYGENYRGVKALVAQEHGAAAQIIYSDPIDDGYFKGDAYPQGPWRPATGVQRGSIGYMMFFPGDPTTPGVASVPDLPPSQRIAPEQSAAQPKIASVPISYYDAQPILQYLTGPDVPHGWQGALPFTYHVGPGPVKVHLHLKQDYQYRPIWDVIGTIRGAENPDEWVVAGNHRDAWVYGAVDPNSGTAAMLETVHGIGTLLKSGWKPKRTLVFGSWDAEEEGLIGSTEWAEQHAGELQNADAYFNMDVGVSGSHFGASSVPSLKQFIRDLSKAVPSPSGQPLYDVWKEQKKEQQAEQRENPALAGEQQRPPAAPSADVPVGDLGSGSDYTAFLQHLGVPATDISSTGSYGVYHSVFDNFAWFTKFGDPTFVYEQEMARVFGLEALRMADADVLPYDYENYGREIVDYVEKAQKKSAEKWGSRAPNFGPALDAARRLQSAGTAALAKQQDAKADAAAINSALRATEHALLLPDGLPGRPWFKHAIYAPGRYTGYAAVVIPGVNEAIDANDEATAERQLAALTDALNRAAAQLQQIH